MARNARKNNKKVANPYRIENPEFNDAMRAKGSSSCTQPHDSRPNRQRTRANAKRNAINAAW